MTNQERGAIADRLVEVVFSLRPDDGPAGQAFTLAVASGALTRAILASIGPKGDPEAILADVHAQVRAAITASQAKYFRQQLATAVPGAVPQ